MPDKAAASLRRIDPPGSGHARARTVLCCVVVLLFAGLPSGSAAAVHSTTTRVEPARLWSQFPLEQTRPSNGAATKAPRLVIVPGGTQTKRPPTAAHRGHVWRDALVAIVAFLAAALLVFAAARRRRRRHSERPLESSDVPTFEGEPIIDGRPTAPYVSEGEPIMDGRATVPQPGVSVANDGPQNGHLVFVPTEDGYTLLERPGDAPSFRRELDGSELGLDGRFRVLKVVASPLPSDERDCVYLERV
jgi:hypothetical protein